MSINRSENLLKIRPIIPSAKLKPAVSEVEFFQNRTLRPIIKFQNDILIAVFKSYLNQKKLSSLNLSPDKMKNIIEQVFQKDVRFKIRIQGIIIGHFTLTEYDNYLKFESEINKRINQIIKERLLSKFL